jgi:hypothetical protein
MKGNIPPCIVVWFQTLWETLSAGASISSCTLPSYQKPLDGMLMVSSYSNIKEVFQQGHRKGEHLRSLEYFAASGAAGSDSLLGFALPIAD